MAAQHGVSQAPAKRGGMAWRVSAAVAALACAGAALAAEPGPAQGRIGVNLPLLTSPFWQAYNGYLPQMAKALGVDICLLYTSPSPRD